MNKNINRQLIVEDLGQISYSEALEIQLTQFNKSIDIKLKNRKEETENPTRNFLFLCEHNHVYTLGKSGAEEHLLLNNSQLKDKNIEFHETNRGGDITYHGPGQLVVYPVIDLENYFTDIHKYMRFLEQAVIDTLSYYGLKGDRYGGFTGVWLYPKNRLPAKICAMGVKTSRWVAMHGLALNVNTDLIYFNNIIPCGINDKDVTSIQRELQTKVQMDDVKKVFVKQFKKIFEIE